MDKQMQITFIGCGDAFADELGNNSALLEFGDTNLLIDIPDSNYGRIKYIGKDYSDIDNIFITHLHADHINGLERFAHYRKFATPIVKPEKAEKKANLFVPETLYHGLWDSVKNGLGITANGMARLEDFFDVHLIKVRDHQAHFVINGVRFYLKPTNHVPNMPVYGLCVMDKFYYSADAKYSGDVPLLLPSVKKVFHDVHFYDSTIDSHASYRDFSDIQPQEAREKIYFMHYVDSHASTNKVEGIRLVKPYEPIII